MNEISIRTNLHNSPFFLLGATIHDDRRRIVELAEEKGLTLDSEICMKARGDLTNPRNRLAIEMAWLPGVTPTLAGELLDSLALPSNDANETSLSPTVHANRHGRLTLLQRRKQGKAISALAYANLIAASLELLTPEMDAELWSEWIVDFAIAVDEIDSEDTFCDINTDREISKFPAVIGLDLVETEISERRRLYTEVLTSALASFPTSKLVEVVTRATAAATDSGQNPAPLLIDELVDRYEMDANRFLQPEAENLQKLIKSINDAAYRNKNAIEPLVDQLEKMLRQWDTVAQPIQLSMKARGLEHDLSHGIAFSARSLAIDLFNKYDMLDTATRLTKTLQELFAELPEVVERLDADSDALDDIYSRRKEVVQRDAQWAREITYQGETETGPMFNKDTLRISPDGVDWQGRRMPLDSINWVRWGAVRNSVNGIASGISCTIALGDTRSQTQMVIHTKKEDVYDAFLERLGKAVFGRLIEEMLEALKLGERIQFGEAMVDDLGVTLHKRKLFGSERTYKRWEEVTHHSYNGALSIIAKNDKNAYANISYIDTPNAHVLEAVIRLSFKKWKGKLSGMIDD